VECQFDHAAAVAVLLAQTSTARHHRRSALSVDDAVQAGATAAGAWSAGGGDVSPCGTLSRSAAGDSLRNRSSNARSHSKLQSLFSLVKVTTRTTQTDQHFVTVRTRKASLDRRLS